MLNNFLTDERGVRSRTTQFKTREVAQPGRAPWYTELGKPLGAYIIGIAGGSASGKTRVAQEILKALNAPSVLVVSQDSFYKSLTPAQSKLAFQNEYDFDCPAAFDWDTLRVCVAELKSGLAVEIPVYSFVEHQRTKDTQYLYGASVVILEGLFVLSDPALRDLMDLKLFVQCDSDLMLARRIRRDTVERGRDVQGIIDQYLKFVKPSETAPKCKEDSDVELQSRLRCYNTADFSSRRCRSSNGIAIELVTTHLRRQLAERALSHRKTFAQQMPRPTGHTTLVNGDHSGTNLPNSVTLLPQTSQLRGIHTILRDENCTSEDFIHFSRRLSTMIIETALQMLPYSEHTVSTRAGYTHAGKKLDADICGVSILRSGQCFEHSLRKVIQDAVLGSLLIQQDDESGEPLLFNARLPPCLKRRAAASKMYVLLSDSQIGTAAACIMAIRVLLDHGVREDNIIFTCFVIAETGGVHAVHRAFPRVRIVTSAIDSRLEERRLPIQMVDSTTGELETVEKHCWAILPGVGNFGDRYFGTATGHRQLA